MENTTILNGSLDVQNLKATESNISMNDLYLALVQCFGIIICGYVAGLLKIISTSETKGLNIFVGTFALPSLIFLSLAELNWKEVNWTFLAANLIAKAIVFFSVCIISLVITKPLNHGRAGIYAMFCTQSNDFAIGYPIVVALYQKIHPEYVSYLYLMVPISLILLNPIAFVLMEISNLRKQNQSLLTDKKDRRPSFGCPPSTEVSTLKHKYMVILKTSRSIFFNPILLMTILGVIGGLAFPNGLPVIVSSILRVFGNSFSATTLFLLGLRMLGKAEYIQSSGFLTPSVLIIVKLLVFPLVNRQIVNVMMNAYANTSDPINLSTFGFLYGTLPTAPGVFVVATQYQVDVDLIASSMVGCTFISAPLMFISAKMISLTNLNPADYLNELDLFAFDISIAGIVACFWMLLLFGLSKRFKRIPQRITCCLLLSQLFVCVGVILWSTMGSRTGWPMYVQFVLFIIGNYSTRLWTAMLAISLLYLQRRSLCFVLKLWPLFVCIAWGVPILIGISLILTDGTNISINGNRNANFQYGNAQVSISICVLVTCFIVTSGCLVMYQRYNKSKKKYSKLSSEVTIETDSSSAFSESTSELVSGYENVSVWMATSDDDCTGSSTENKHDGLEALEFPENIDEYQTMRHSILLMLLLCSMFVGLALSIWTVMMEGMSGIYVELSFLDAFLNFGQSLIVLLCFITDTELLHPFMNWSKIWYGTNELLLSDCNDISAETKHVCDQFINYHLDACRRAIAEDKLWRVKIWKNVFYGSRFIDWCIEVGLAKDRVEATHYAGHLIDGRVLRHINNVYHFRDTNVLYTFDRKSIAEMSNSGIQKQFT